MSGRAPLLGDGSGLSRDRRRFIIISIFDATFAVLLWLICTVTKGDDWPKVFLQEINIFDSQFIHHSLFDVVLCALLRMIVLIFCYAIWVVRHWFPVAITTSVSSIFLIIKVLLFFSKSQNSLPQYLLVLGSFSIAWFELWLMPFKVLPRERLYLRQRNSIDDSTHDDEAAVPVRPTRIRPRSANSARALPPHTTDDEFRSAVDFSSDDEPSRQRIPSIEIPAMLREIYEKAIHEAEQRVELLMRESRSGNWKVLRSDAPMVQFGPDQSYIIRADFRCSPVSLFNALWREVLKWNTQVTEAKMVLSLNNNMELFYSSSAPALKGYISSRDFVDIRKTSIDQERNIYSGVFVSVESTLCPANANKKIVRGHNGPSLIRCMPGSSPGESQLEWLMKTDLRGGLPKRLVQNSMLTYFVEHIDRLRKYVETVDTAFSV